MFLLSNESSNISSAYTWEISCILHIHRTMLPLSCIINNEREKERATTAKPPCKQFYLHYNNRQCLCYFSVEYYELKLIQANSFENIHVHTFSIAVVATVDVVVDVVDNNGLETHRLVKF